MCGAQSRRWATPSRKYLLSGRRDPLFRQRNELALLRDRSEAPLLPILLGRLDALAARGDEIPPDVARALQRGAAEVHEAGGAHRPARAWIAPGGGQQPWALRRL